MGARSVGPCENVRRSNGRETFACGHTHACARARARSHTPTRHSPLLHQSEAAAALVLGARSHNKRAFFLPAVIYARPRPTLRSRLVAARRRTAGDVRNAGLAAAASGYRVYCGVGGCSKGRAYGLAVVSCLAARVPTDGCSACSFRRECRRTEKYGANSRKFTHVQVYSADAGGCAETPSSSFSTRTVSDFLSSV